LPTALILGGAECVWDDAERALDMFTPDAVLAINDSIPRWSGRLDYAVTLHPPQMEGWLKERRNKGLNVSCEVWAHKHHGNVVHRVTTDWAGSSGLFACKVLMQEGFGGIVLAGVPMERERGHIVRLKPWISATMFRKGWLVHKGEISAIVRSMSGWTMELLGSPTADWLQQVGSAAGRNAIRRQEVGNANTEIGT
jgi:hypothetical protein